VIRWIVLCFFLGACSQAPQGDADEKMLANQAKGLEAAADAMVNRSISNFEIVDVPDRERAETTDTINQSK
jgi:hypothetical protein